MKPVHRVTSISDDQQLVSCGHRYASRQWSSLGRSPTRSVALLGRLDTSALAVEIEYLVDQLRELFLDALQTVLTPDEELAGKVPDTDREHLHFTAAA